MLISEKDNESIISMDLTEKPLAEIINDDLGGNVKVRVDKSTGEGIISGTGTINYDYWQYFWRNYIGYCKTITIKNTGIYLPADSSDFFFGCPNLIAINNLNYLNTSKVTNMSYMFSQCSKLKKINLSNWNTSNVVNMHQMFSLTGLTELDLSSFDMRKVTDAGYFLEQSYSLKTIKTPKLYSSQTINLPPPSKGATVKWYNTTNPNDSKIYKNFKNGTFSGSVTLSRTKPIQPAYIKGKILTENHGGNHTVAITLYKLDNTSGNQATSCPINNDGTYSIQIQKAGTYELVIEKGGYITHKITNIKVELGKTIDLGIYNMIAGDITEDGEIELDDLVKLNDNYKKEITEKNKIYDLNEDGQINSEDRKIMLKNFGKM